MYRIHVQRTALITNIDEQFLQDQIIIRISDGDNLKRTYGNAMPIYDIYELRKNKNALRKFAETLIDAGLHGNAEKLADEIQKALYEQL